MPKTSTKGLEFYNLSTEWKHGMPQWPSKANMNIKIREFHAKDGLQTLEYEGIMHRGTHMDAPIHVLENTPFITDYETWRFFGTGVVVSIPKGKWGVVTPEDLEKATPKIQPGDIVMVNTGSHRNWGDNPDYFAYSPGLYKAGGGMAGAEEDQAVRHRRAGARPSARHVLGPARPGPGAAASRRRIFRRERPPHHRRFPVSGSRRTRC